ncbi:MAG TPA: DUF2007 domain-containing protein [Bacteroidia bacterium]|nr:DUF2007 domain-containing protein [Bacteroidia bacterium]
MPTLVTILSLPYPQQVYIIKGRLESEGIECFIKDELTVQTNPVYSYAVGGVKLQVKEEDVEAATKILEEEGYLNRNDRDVNPYKWLETFADRLPFFKKVRFEARLGIYVLAVIAAVCLPVYFLTRPDTSKKLSDPFCWCVDHITYKGTDYFPKSYGVSMVFGGCKENFDFKIPGSISLPGFKTFPVKANWEVTNDSLIISHADTFQFVYNGRYAIEFSRNNLVLKSKNTSIYCTCFYLFGRR